MRIDKKENKKLWFGSLLSRGLSIGIKNDQEPSSNYLDVELRATHHQNSSALLSHE